MRTKIILDEELYINFLVLLFFILEIYPKKVIILDCESKEG